MLAGSSESPIQFTAINAVTERGRQVQTKKNMLQSQFAIIIASLYM